MAAQAKENGHDARAQMGLMASSAFGRRHERLPSLLQSLGPGDRALYFFHVLLPHAPWEYLPSGQRYARLRDALPPRSGVWPDGAGVVAQGYGRYLLQLGYTDRWLGELLERLRGQGIFDQALVVVTADHGAAFVPGEEQRFYSEANAPEIAAVPLLVKLPGQRHGEVVERPLSLLDLVPTMLEALEVPVPPEAEGRSLLAPPLPPSPLPFVLREGQRITLASDLPQRVLEASRQLRGLIPEGLDGPFRAGPHSELVGRSVAELDIAGTAQARLVAFQDGRFHAEVSTGRGRPDVAELLGIPELADAGFALQLPEEELADLRSGRIRVFAVSPERFVATEAPVASFLAAREAPGS